MAGGRTGNECPLTPIKAENMSEHLQSNMENCVAIHVRKEISSREMADIDRTLEERIQRYGKIRLFVIMETYPTFNSAESIYEDLRFAKKYSKHIERMAVLGDQAWKKHWIAMFGLFGGITSEYFVRSDFKSAIRWIQSG
jgi:hypothetical protein